MVDTVRVAAVDIGTNTTRLLIVDVVHQDGTSMVHWLERSSTVTSLGQGVDATGHLMPVAIDRTIAALETYRAVIVSSEVERAGAVATSAARRAANAAAFLDLAFEALGTRPVVIDGAREAQMALAGVASSFAHDSDLMVIDIGGGSTELVVGGETVNRAVSVDVGSMRVTETTLTHLPPDQQQLAAARGFARSRLEHARWSAPPTVAGVGGTFTSLAAIHLGHQEYDAATVHGTELTIDDVGALVERLARLDLDQLESIPSLEPARAPVITGGAVVAHEAMLAVGAASIVVSEADILDGLALALASGTDFQ